MTPEFRRLLTMLGGFATTALTLSLAVTTSFGDWIHEFRPLPFLLPTGAFSVGLLAGSGFALVGWALLGLRFTRPMLLGVAAAMLVAYGGTVMVEFVQHAPEGVGFLDYLDQVTRASVVVTTHGRTGEVTVSTPIGIEGYNYRLLELLGLCCGGMGALFVIPLVRGWARAKPSLR